MYVQMDNKQNLLILLQFREVKHKNHNEIPLYNPLPQTMLKVLKNIMEYIEVLARIGAI